MKDSDIHKARQRSVWNENSKEWQIPSFILSDKKAEISFPTISGKQRVDQAREDKSIVFDRDGSPTKS